MTGYERHNSHIAYFLGGNIMWIKKNDLLVNLEKFDALYQDTLHPENLVIMTDRKKRTLTKSHIQKECCDWMFLNKSNSIFLIIM